MNFSNRYVCQRSGHHVSLKALSLMLAGCLALGGIPAQALAEEFDETDVAAQMQVQGETLGEDATSAETMGLEAQESASNYDAALYDSAGNYPGVYATKVQPNAATDANAAATIRIPSISDTALKDTPTTESPAIICGSAFPWGPYGNGEENARKFTAVSPSRVAPYSYFKFGVMDQVGTDGVTRKKLSGFDGTYVIVRLDVSGLWNSVPADKRNATYLHVSQDKNNALLVAVGMDANASLSNKDGRDQWGNISFSNLFTADSSSGTQYQKKTASYKLSEMYDADGKDKATPYFDVILFSTAGIVSGADAQKENALNGDVELSFYFDQTADYDPAVNWDPQSTDTTLSAKCHAKFYNEDKAKEAGATISRYKVKGSELHLETMVEKSDSTNARTTFWSLEKAIEHTYYDQQIDKSKSDSGCGRTVTLMSEVPVINNLALKGTSADSLRKRTLDVNSFDIQVANNTSPAAGEYTSGIWLENAWLKIADQSNTTGAELAIGNNATMTIEAGGKLIVDETCQLEIEWDGATTQPAANGQVAQAATDVLNNGSLDLRKGGEVQNDGVVTIEGTEGKPYQPGQEQAAAGEKGHGELSIFEGATFTNNGCLMPNGALYVQGTLINNGKFNDRPIVSDDPDRGTFTYHRGIQCTWKDDVTQENIIYGGIYVGLDKTWAKAYPNAVVTNNGDIVLCPGELINQAKVNNMTKGAIYLCATDKAIIPIEPDPATPNITTKEVVLSAPAASRVMNWGTIDNQGEIKPAQVELTANGSLDKLVLPGKFDELFSLTCWETGELTGSGSVYNQSLESFAVNVIIDGETVDSVVYDGTNPTFGLLVSKSDSVYCGTNDFTDTYLDPQGNAIAKDKIIDVGTYKIQIKGKNAFSGTVTKDFTITSSTITEVAMHRLYNPNSGEHFYTANQGERDNLVTLGWSDEGVGWVAPVKSSVPVYRLYSGTDHHYTTDVSERDHLVSVGWRDEGIGWYSDEGQHVALYRQFNPNVDPSAPMNNSGSHNYTTSKEENDALVGLGWKAEGIGWYAIEGARPA